MFKQIEILNHQHPWLAPLGGLVAAVAINALVMLTLRFAGAMGSSEMAPIDPSVSVEVGLVSARALSDDTEMPQEPEPFAGAFVIQNNLPTDLFAQIQPDAKKLNGLLDTDDGGTELRLEGKRSGGGGGSGADSLAMGHVASDDHVWARMKFKSDKTSSEVAAGDDSGRGLTVPGTLKNAGSGAGLGNGNGSGALGSQGSGTGSGAGTNGSNIGTGLGVAAPPRETRKPGVISMNRGPYPFAARAARHEGTVVLSVEVLPTGNVGKVAIGTSSGFEELDQAAADAAKDWLFTGAIKDGKPASFWYTIPYRFMLTEY